MYFDLKERVTERNLKVLAELKSKDIKNMKLEELIKLMSQSQCLIDGESLYLKEIMPLFYENDMALEAMSYGLPGLYNSLFDLGEIARRSGMGAEVVYYQDNQLFIGGYIGLRAKHIEKWLESFDLSTIMNKKTFLLSQSGNKELNNNGEQILWQRIFDLIMDKYIGSVVVESIDSLIKSPLGQKVGEFFEKGEEQFFKKYSEEECLYALKEEMRDGFEALGLVFFLALIKNKSERVEKESSKKDVVSSEQFIQSDLIGGGLSVGLTLNQDDVSGSSMRDSVGVSNEKTNQDCWDWCEKVYKKIREKIIFSNESSAKSIGLSGGGKEVLLLDETMAKLSVFNDSAKGLRLVLRVNGEENLVNKKIRSELGVVGAPTMLKMFTEGQCEVKRLKKEKVRGGFKSIGAARKEINGGTSDLYKNLCRTKSADGGLSLSLAVWEDKKKYRNINEHLRGARVSEVPRVSLEYLSNEQDRQMAIIFNNLAKTKGLEIARPRQEKSKLKLNWIKRAMQLVGNMMFNFVGKDSFNYTRSTEAVVRPSTSYGEWLTTDLMMALGSTDCLREVINIIGKKAVDKDNFSSSAKMEVTEKYLKQKVVLTVEKSVPIECWLAGDVLHVFLRQKGGGNVVLKGLVEALGEKHGRRGEILNEKEIGTLKLVMEEVENDSNKSIGRVVQSYLIDDNFSVGEEESKHSKKAVEQIENNFGNVEKGRCLGELGIFRAKDRVSSERLVTGEFLVVSNRAWNFISKIKRIKECQPSKRGDLWKKLFKEKSGPKSENKEAYKEKMCIEVMNIKSQSLYLMHRNVPAKSVAFLIEHGAVNLGESLSYLKVMDEKAYNFYSKGERLSKLEEAQLKHDIAQIKDEPKVEKKRLDMEVEDRIEEVKKESSIKRKKFL